MHCWHGLIYVANASRLDANRATKVTEGDERCMISNVNFIISRCTDPGKHRFFAGKKTNWRIDLTVHSSQLWIVTAFMFGCKYKIYSPRTIARVFVTFLSLRFAFLSFLALPIASRTFTATRMFVANFLKLWPRLPALFDDVSFRLVIFRDEIGPWVTSESTA